MIDDSAGANIMCPGLTSPNVAAELAKNDIGTNMPVAIMAEVGTFQLKSTAL